MKKAKTLVRVTHRYFTKKKSNEKSYTIKNSVVVLASQIKNKLNKKIEDSFIKYEDFVL